MVCISQVYEALNAMGETAWSINPVILKRIQTAYIDLKGGFCGLPLHDSVPTVPLPPKPTSVFRSEGAKNGQLVVGVSPETCFVHSLSTHGAPRVFHTVCAGLFPILEFSSDLRALRMASWLLG